MFDLYTDPQWNLIFCALIPFTTFFGTFRCWLVVFYVPSTARSFRDSIPIYCPLWRTWNSVNTPFPPRIQPGAVEWQSITLPLRHASSTFRISLVESLCGKANEAPGSLRRDEWAIPGTLFHQTSILTNNSAFALCIWNIKKFLLGRKLHTIFWQPNGIIPTK